MPGFKNNFLKGLLVGVTLAIVAPFATIDLVGSAVPSAEASSPQHEIQTVNRAGKSDRLHNPQRAKQDVDNSNKLPSIPIGCDPAFSPLSKGARSNFSSRCLV